MHKLAGEAADNALADLQRAQLAHPAAVAAASEVRAEVRKRYALGAADAIDGRTGAITRAAAP